MPNSTRLTIWIDRQDMSRSVSAVYVPGETASDEIPDTAWTLIEPPSAPTAPSGRPSKKR